MTPESVLSSFKKKFKTKVKNGKVEKVPHKLKKTYKLQRVWFDIDRKYLKDAVAHLCKQYPYPHFVVCSGYDNEKDIVMNYHFTINYAKKAGEITVSMRVTLPKKDAVIESITSLIPGALISEREMQEMLGITIDGIPDSRRLFLDESFPKGVFPWRRDKTCPDKLVRRTN